MSPDDFAASNQKLLQDMSEAGFDIGSPKSIANNIEPFLKLKQKTLSSYGKLSNTPADISEIKNLYTSNLKYIKSNSGSGAKFKDLSEALFAKKNPTVQDVLSYKQAVDELGGGVNLLRKSKPELAKLMTNIRDESRSLLTNDPAVDEVLSSLSNGLRMKGTILKNPEIAVNWNIPFTGVKFNARPAIDALRPSGLGQKVAKGPIGKTAEFLGKGVTGQLPINVGGAMLGSTAMGVGQPEQQTQSGLPLENGAPDFMIDPTTGFLQLPGGAEEESQAYTVEDALRQAAKTLPGGSESEIMSLAKMYMEQNATPPVSKEQAAMMTTTSIIDEVERMVGGLDLSKSDLGAATLGRGRGVIGSLVPSSEAGQFQTFRKGVMSRLARALGEVGVLTDKDIERAINLIPSLADTPESAANRIQQLRSLLGEAASAYGQTKGANPNLNLYGDYNSWNQ